MNAPPRDPFDAEEARVKRAYDALPQGEPSAALDARILAQARSAVAPRARRPRPWFLGAGLGTAAAAVFAAGIAWQLGVFKGDDNLSTVPAQVPAAQEEVYRIDIEFVKQERKRDAADAKAPFGRDAAPAVTAPQAPSAAASAPYVEPQSAPPPPPPPKYDDADKRRDRAEASKPRPEPMQEAATDAANTAQPFPAETPADRADGFTGEVSGGAREREVAGGLAREQQRAAPAREAPLGAAAGARPAAASVPPAPPPEAAPSASPDAANAATASTPSDDGQLDQISVTGSRLAKEVALPPWADDAQLPPDAWLERLSDRVQAGDRQGAKHSLQRFVLAHPQRKVPRDLQRLLVE